MPIDDDPLAVISQQIATNLSSYPDAIRDGVIKAAISQVPLIGAAIAGVIGEIAQKRWQDRVVELLTLLAERMSTMTDQIDSADYYLSEEFQALLWEAIDQQRANRFQEKRRMLASGLANSGSKSFVNDKDKETYFRLVRDLTLNEVGLLRSLQSEKNNSSPPIPQRGVNSLLYRLQGLGLVASRQELKHGAVNIPRKLDNASELKSLIEKALQTQTLLTFQVTGLGSGFLRFLSVEENMHSSESPSE